MKAEPATTPPQELFRELTDLGNLIFSMLTGSQVVVKRWPADYMVYLQVDQLCREVSRATGYLSRGFIEPDGHASAERIDQANACLIQIGACCRAVVDLLARIERHGLVSYGNPALKNIVASHFSSKSAWFLAFQAQYCSGQVSRDRRLLERNVLLLDPHPTFKRPTSRRTASWRTTRSTWRPNPLEHFLTAALAWCRQAESGLRHPRQGIRRALPINQ